MSETVSADGVLNKAMVILDAFGPDADSLRMFELVQRTGLPKTTMHRLLGELLRLRLIERDKAGAYRLGGRLFELGMGASLERRLLEVAMPFLQDLYERCHETVHLGVREGSEVIYVSKIGGHRQAQAPSRVGGRMPLYCTAIGKVLLAHADSELVRRVLSGPLEQRTPRTITAPGLLRQQLDRVLEEGVAFEYEESAIGLVCVAAAVLDQDDRPVGAISVAGPTTRYRPERDVDALRTAAAGVCITLARRAQLAATGER